MHWLSHTTTLIKSITCFIQRNKRKAIAIHLRIPDYHTHFLIVLCIFIILCAHKVYRGHCSSAVLSLSGTQSSVPPLLSSDGKLVTGLRGKVDGSLRSKLNNDSVQLDDSMSNYVTLTSGVFP